jgi:hypothetical protein
LFILKSIEGQFRRASGAEYTLTAKTGIYDTKVKELDLEGACHHRPEGPPHGA